jgi:hypothetical protein
VIRLTGRRRAEKPARCARQPVDRPASAVLRRLGTPSGASGPACRRRRAGCADWMGEGGDRLADRCPCPAAGDPAGGRRTCSRRRSPRRGALPAPSRWGGRGASRSGLPRARDGLGPGVVAADGRAGYRADPDALGDHGVVEPDLRRAGRPPQAVVRVRSNRARRVDRRRTAASPTRFAPSPRLACQRTRRSPPRPGAHAPTSVCPA